MVANERGQQVMRRGHRVCISGQMEIHFFLRDDLRAPAAGTASLDAEHGTETGLAQRHESAETQPTQAHGQADRGDGLPFAQRCGVDGGDQHVAAERPAAEPIERGQRDLALVAAVGDQFLIEKPQVGGELLRPFRERHGRRRHGGALRLEDVVRDRCGGPVRDAKSVGHGGFWI